jgi:hypothetical protein
VRSCLSDERKEKAPTAAEDKSAAEEKPKTTEEKATTEEKPGTLKVH